MTTKRTTRYMDSPEYVQMSFTEQMFSKRKLEKWYMGGTDVDVPAIDFIARSKGFGLSEKQKLAALWEKDPWLTRRVGLSDEDLPGMGEFEVSYNFPERTRNNVFVTTGYIGGDLLEGVHTGKYGKDGFTMRMLYEWLCRAYNDGDYFVDRYFTDVFPSSSVYPKFMDLRRRITLSMAEELLEEKRRISATVGRDVGRTRLTGDKNRFISTSQASEEQIKVTYEQMYGGYGDFSVWSNTYYQRELEDIGGEIRDDVVRALSIGEIPLQKATLSAYTAKRREMFGFNEETVFYASGSLIRSLNIYVHLGEAA